MASVLNILAKRHGGSKNINAHWAISNRTLYQKAVTKVTALSPSNVMFSRSLQELAQYLPTVGQTIRKAVPKNPNDISVVVLVEFGDIYALLGADLEIGSTNLTGWKAILNSSVRPNKKAQIFKIPHHGSDDAHDDEVWTQLLEPNPVATLTPFKRSHLPTVGDVNRIKKLAGLAYCTASSGASSPARRPALVEKMLKPAYPRWFPNSLVRSLCFAYNNNKLNM